MTNSPKFFLPKESLGFVLSDVSRLMRRNFNRRVQELGLTQTQWQALAHLSRNEGIKQSQLAELLEVQPISVARLIDRMESAGWVTRCPDPHDRRAVNLHLSDKATPILQVMQKHALELRQQVLSGLSETEQAAMMQNLLLMRKNLCDECN